MDQFENSKLPLTVTQTSKNNLTFPRATERRESQLPSNIARRHLGSHLHRTELETLPFSSEGLREKESPFSVLYMLHHQNSSSTKLTAQALPLISRYSFMRGVIHRSSEDSKAALVLSHVIVIVIVIIIVEGQHPLRLFVCRHSVVAPTVL